MQAASKPCQLYAQHLTVKTFAEGVIRDMMTGRYIYTLLGIDTPHRQICGAIKKRLFITTTVNSLSQLCDYPCSPLGVYLSKPLPPSFVCS